RLDIDPVDHEAVLGEDGFVARRKVDLRQQAENLIRAVGADDVCRIETMDLADGFAQPSRRAVGIYVQSCGHIPRGLYRLGRRPKRIFIGRELEKPDASRRGALARHIGLNVHDACTRCRTRLNLCLVHLHSCRSVRPRALRLLALREYRPALLLSRGEGASKPPLTAPHERHKYDPTPW